MAFNVANNTTSCQFFPLVFSQEDISLSLLLEQTMFSRLAKGKNRLIVEDCLKQNSLYRLKHPRGIVYRGAIAFKLHKQFGLSPQEFAQSLYSLFSSPILPKENTTQQEIWVRVTVVEPGWLDFAIWDDTLASWVDHLFCCFEQTQYSLSGLEKTEKEQWNCFPFQVTYARCSALLRLGAQQNLIQLQIEDCGQIVGQWLEPAKIPWLKDNQQWQLVHPSEKNLLDKLIDTMDLFSNNSWKNWNQVTNELSNAFFDFEASCRIFGDVSKKTPWLAQCRLGLIRLTQLSLHKLLTQKLGVQVLTQL